MRKRGLAVMGVVAATTITGAVTVVAAAGGIVMAAQRGHDAPASFGAIRSFMYRAEQRAVEGTFVATYRVSLFRSHGRMFRARVFAADAWGLGSLFRETPAFPMWGPSMGVRSYEVLSPPRGYMVECSQTRTSSSWQCMSEKGEGMGTMSGQNEAIAPSDFASGLSNAIGGYYTSGSTQSAPQPIYLRGARLDGRVVRCMDFGNPAGAIGQVCTMSNGFIVSYRMPRQLTEGDYATAELVSYSTRVRRGLLQPPARPVLPGG